MKKFRRILLAVMFLAGCEASGQGYLSQQKLLQMINRSASPVVVDVRSQREYQAGHVPGALHVPFWTAFTTQRLVKVNKERLLVLYCEHGPRAGVAKLAFSLAGYQHVVYLAGHMSAWREAGLPMEK
ncbi:rhodanese-like domain-containing protein [Methylomarinum vadi]|uniref:rhodanese-like domain-containing protein n=1 Tax=Methylomarinum vadi TaxID=438855 RepID=UPI000691DA37|nr:rhodanese-like domain-containing protein [Methylomarinum vadi]